MYLPDKIATHPFSLFTLLALVSLACSSASSATDYSDLPPSAEATTPLTTGDAAPEFTVRTVDNKPFVFDPKSLEKPTILISFRGGWCPYCNFHLAELRKVIPDLKAEGFDVLFLSNDRPEILYLGLSRETQDSIDGLDYTILSDAEINAGRALGTAFRVPGNLGSRLASMGRDAKGSSIEKHGALTVPAVYVINQSGDIVFDFVNADYSVRLPADDLLAKAREVLAADS